MVKLRGDEFGLLWTRRIASTARVLAPPPVWTPTDWRPPTEFPSLQGCKRIAIDTETKDTELFERGPGTQRGDSYIVGISIATDSGFNGYYPIRHEGGGNMDENLVLRWAREEFAAYTGEVVGTKLIYDLDFLANENIYFNPGAKFRDIQHCEALLDEHRLQYNLDALAWDYLQETKADALLLEAAKRLGVGERPRDVKSNIWRMPASYAGVYGATDSLLPLRILPLQLKRLEEENLLTVFDIECRQIPLLLRMRRTGVRIDLDRAEEAYAKLKAKRDEATAEFRHLVGSSRAEINAVASFGQAFIDLGLPVRRTKKTNQVSITKAWLKEYEHIPVVAALTKAKRYDKAVGTFMEGHIFGHHVNGRIYTEFNQLKSDEAGTIGRYSSTNPNLQQIPQRDDELAEILRSLFLAEEGERWECDDYSQIEVRFEAHYAVGARAEEFRQAYIDNPNTDYHEFTARMLEMDIQSKGDRVKIKGVNFAKKYGAQPPKLAALLGINVDEAKAFVAKYEAAMPFTKRTFEKIAEVASERGYVKTILGRRARFPLWEPASNQRTKMEFRKPAFPRERAEQEYPNEYLVRAYTYKAMNNVMQLGSADMLKKAMADSWDAGVFDHVKPLLTVHDELDISVPRTKEADEAATEMRRIMETTIKLKVPVVVDSKRGANWGECR